MGLDHHIIQVNDGIEQNYVKIYLLIINEGDSSSEYVLNFYTHNQLYDFVHKMSYHLVFLVFAWLGIQLIIEGLKQKKEEEELQASIYTKYGFGFLMGGLATFAWEFYN